MVFKLIQELAEYEKAPDQVTNSIELMEKEGFGSFPVYEFLVAEHEGEIIGTSIYYFRYSTWKGKRLYLEDLVITQSHRRKNVGTLLFNKTKEIALEGGSSGMSWQVLDWNQSAIDFYKKYDTQFEEGWVNCNLDF